MGNTLQQCGLAERVLGFRNQAAGSGANGVCHQACIRRALAFIERAVG